MIQYNAQRLSEVKEIQARKLSKALAHLDYSFNIVQKLNTDPSTLSEQDLAQWEAFAARFSRVSDIFLSRYLRTLILIDDPGFEGTFRDILNKSEKLGYGGSIV